MDVTVQYDKVPLLKNDSDKKRSCYCIDLCLLHRKVVLVVILCLQVPVLYYLYKQESFHISYLEGAVSYIPSHANTIAHKTTTLVKHNITEVKTLSTHFAILSTTIVMPTQGASRDKDEQQVNTEGGETSTINSIKTTVAEALIKTNELDNIPADESKDNKVLPLCPETPPGLQGNLFVSFAQPSHSFEKIHEDNPLVADGGHFKPKLCSARSKVAIIIPFRNRDMHLHYFLQYMHPTLQRQQLEYKIYIINQYGSGKFNRAKLMNVGFAESKKDLDFGCFVFHDVDLILENDNAIYSCPEKPRHLSSAVDKFNYQLPYQSIFGGVTELTKEQFELANGYSNSFWGWGGEDDDMFNRIRIKKMNIMRYPITVSRYKMISHKREKGNEENPQRFDLIRKTHLTMNNDGLNSLKYDVIKRDNNQLYTNITVEIYPPQ